MKQKGILDLLYPPRCPVCDGVLLSTEEVCPECSIRLRYVSGARCFRCGKSLQEEETEICHDCKNRPHIYDSGLSLYEYESIKDSLYRFKYKGRCEYAGFYGKEIAGRLGEKMLAWHPDALIPVPMHKKKERTRGYNQADILAEAVGRYLSVPVMSGLVQRQINTVPMKELEPGQRQINLKKAFIMNHFDVKLKCVIIMDDIYTTGSTIDEMARVLKNAGIKFVHFVTLAVGKGL